MNKEFLDWPTIVNIIEAAINSDIEKAHSYSSLLADRLEDIGEETVAAHIRRILKSKKTSKSLRGSSLSPFSPAVGIPVDSESRNTFVDEVKSVGTEPPILNTIVAAKVDRFVQLQHRAADFANAGIPIPRSLLLYGPPGCGKNKTAEYVASELGLSLSVVRLDAVISSYLGATAKNLRMAFEHAARRPAALFLDEFDALAKMRDDTNEVGELKRIVNSLIQNIDAFPDLYIIAATNHEHLLDSAIWRRFDLSVEIPLPEFDERIKLLNLFLRSNEIESSDLNWAACMTDQCSGSDLEQVAIRCRQEKILSPSTPLIQLLIKEIWHCKEGDKALHNAAGEDKLALIKFIDSKTDRKVPAKTVELLTGISDSTVARLRRTKGDNVVHGQ